MSRERDSDESLTSAPARRRILRRLAAGLVGFGALWVGYEALTWPDVAALRDANPDRTAFIDRYVERSGRAPAWTWVPASRISPHLEEAVIVGEDLEFFSHGGFSTHEIEQAIRRAIEEREAPRGASTITQQLAKNLWLSPSRNPLRKGREVILTKQLEGHLTKDRILELYLNVVEFGPGIYGAEAAGRHYFGKPASALSQREAAMLAAALPRPSQWHPGVTSTYYARRVETLLERMRQVTFLDRRLGIEEPAAEDVPLEVREPPAAAEVTPIEPSEPPPDPEDPAVPP
ncbi:MAG TPA: monofunctional biosynthetic peptidoglycan transglycosylase [Gemmatimonadota bacterium]|nr:monofunctional biosynthetic peptidoglycan transglycosylase [Gemmatimonadota bacterium]